MTTAVLLLLLPILIIEFGLLIFALVDLVRRQKVRGGNKWLWGILIVFVSYIGPILYFVLGREEE